MPYQEERVRFLLRVIAREVRHLTQTDQRLFANGLSRRALETLEDQPELAERVEAFVSRFCRLQDSLGDKLLPALLSLAGESPRTALENLDRAERLGWIASADGWLALRKLRNQMIHEYIEDVAVLTDALNYGHEAVAILVQAAEAMTIQATRLLER